MTEPPTGRSEESFSSSAAEKRRSVSGALTSEQRLCSPQRSPIEGMLTPHDGLTASLLGPGKPGCWACSAPGPALRPGYREVLCYGGPGTCKQPLVRGAARRPCSSRPVTHLVFNTDGQQLGWSASLTCPRRCCCAEGTKGIPAAVGAGAWATELGPYPTPAGLSCLLLTHNCWYSQSPSPGVPVNMD